MHPYGPGGGYAAKEPSHLGRKASQGIEDFTSITMESYGAFHKWWYPKILLVGL